MRCYVANRNTFVIPGLVRREVATVVSAKYRGSVEDGARVQLLVVCAIPCQALGPRRTSQHRNNAFFRHHAVNVERLV